MGFGTGEHETTYLCLKAFEDLRKDQQTSNFSHLLDFGCGSGILGVAALRKMPGVYCEFCDVDTNALDNCLQNLLLNFTKDELQAQRLVSREKFDPSERPEGFDLVFANILESVLLAEKETISSSLAEGGHLIVSGVLTEQIENIVHHYSNLRHLDTYKKGDWACLVFENRRL